MKLINRIYKDRRIFLIRIYIYNLLIKMFDIKNININYS
jgi:hypothetical protein